MKPILISILSQIRQLALNEAGAQMMAQLMERLRVWDRFEFQLIGAERKQQLKIKKVRVRKTNSITNIAKAAGMMASLLIFQVSSIASTGAPGSEEQNKSLQPFDPTAQIYSNQPLFSIHGSNTIGAKLAPALVSDYLLAKQLENVQVLKKATENEVIVQGREPSSGKLIYVEIQAHGSSTGFKGLKSGSAQIAAASRPIKEKEKKQLSLLGDMSSVEAEHILAIDGLSVIVHPDNPVSELSKSTLAKVFTGEIKNWKELGGLFGEIKVYARDDKSGTWDSFKGMVLGKKRKLIDNAERFESNTILSNKVANDVNGIGFVSLATIGESKALAIKDGGMALHPTTLTIGTEDYPLSRRLYFYSSGQGANQFAKEFLKFALERQGQKTVKTVGFVSQNIRGYEAVRLNQYPSDLQERLSGAERLSVNFRFKQGSAQLDNKAKLDIKRLVEFLNTNNRDRELVLIGFGDPRKDNKRTQLLSKLRAMAVRRELVKLGIYPDEVTGLGDQLQVASNADFSTRIKNRRVEVWLR